MKMYGIIVLDSTPLGLLAASQETVHGKECTRWLADLQAARCRVIVPEIVDYELRRELLRQNRRAALETLDFLIEKTEYLKISSVAMRDAAAIWSDVRRRGLPTAGDKDIDIDAILAAQARSLASDDAVIATSNVKHLSRYFPAAPWQSIVP